MSTPITPKAALDVNVSGYRCKNWRAGGPAPLIVNPEADLHALLAWCWGEAMDLQLLHSAHSSDEESTASDLVAIGMNRVMGLTAMLKHLAQQTLPAKGGQA